MTNPAPLPIWGTLLAGTPSGGSVSNPAPLPHLSLMFGTGGNLTMTVDTGYYTLTGSTVLVDIELDMAFGSYTQGGQTVGLRADRRLTCEGTTFATNGQAVQLQKGRVLTIEQGTYTLTGQDVGLNQYADNVMPVGDGLYTLTGQSVGLHKGWVMSFEQGTYTYTGNFTDLYYNERANEVVPYLLGDTLANATARIASIYCTASVTGSSGTVQSQSPDAFTTVPRGTTISITMGGPTNHGRRRKRDGNPPYNSGVN